MVFRTNDKIHVFIYFFFFNDTATTEIYTLSLHDALPIFLVEAKAHLDEVQSVSRAGAESRSKIEAAFRELARKWRDRKSTRLNSSHSQISYAVFCLKKKKNVYLTWCHQLTSQSSEPKSRQ